MTVTPGVVLQQVNMQSASHCVSHCVKAAEHPDFPEVEKKFERIFEECGRGLKPLSNHPSQLRDDWSLGDLRKGYDLTNQEF